MPMPTSSNRGVREPEAAFVSGVRLKVKHAAGEHLRRHISKLGCARLLSTDAQQGQRLVETPRTYPANSTLTAALWLSSR
jgi:hypothetical protein